MTNFVHTVLGPVASEQLGITLLHESLLSVVPGAQYAYDIKFDRAEIFETIAIKLSEYKRAGGGTVVDSSGMFHGRDLVMYEALSELTGVNIVASTGLGPEENLGGYFLTPQTNPPTPWPAEKFEDLFSKELADGMVRPRLERRNKAGLVAVRANQSGITATEVSLFKGAARAASKNGTALTVSYGSNAIIEVQYLLEEGLQPNRVIAGSLDRKGSNALEVAQMGVFVALDNVGNNASEFLTDSQRVELIIDLLEAGYGSRIIVSSNSAAVAKGHADSPVDFAYVLQKFVPALEAKGVSREAIDQILIENPKTLLEVANG